MKKLMFAMAAVAAGTVIADITSNNIVGYAGSELDTEYGSKLITPQFLNVGAEGITLDKITPKAEGGVGDYNVYVQCLNSSGETIEDESYGWIGGQWTDGNEQPVAADKITFPAGKGLYVLCYMGETPTTLQSSGEVGQEDVVVALDTEYGSVLTGNPFPVAITLADITPFVEGDLDVGDYNVYVQCLNSSGETIEDESYGWIGGQWTDGNEQPVAAESITFAPGQGLYVLCYTGETQAYLRIPAPEL